MFEQQLQELRREKWCLNGQPVRTLDQAREFIDSVGFCLLYPQRPAALLPTFVGAYAGNDEKLPTAQMAFADPQAHAAKELMVRLLREKAAYEANVFPDNNFIVSASAFPYFYGLVGDRNPRQAPKAAARSGYSPLAVDTFPIIQKEGPISKNRLRELLGGDISEAALDRALDELWAKSAHYARRLQTGRGHLLGCALPLVARSSKRRYARVGGRGADRISFEIS